MKDDPEPLEALTARMDALEKRVDVLEHELARSVVNTAVQTPTAQVARSSVPHADDAPSGPGFLLLAGRSLLGIAGAYLLRALAESAASTRWLVGLLAAVYAVGWLMAATRASSQRRLEPVFYTLTSLLILAPMLWEMTLRFHAFSAMASLGILAVFVIAVNALTWNSDRRATPSIGNVGVALTALALSVATHQMAAFTVLVLVLMAIGEFRRMRGQDGIATALIVLVADLCVWALLVIYGVPASARVEYPLLHPGWPLAFAWLLFALGVAALAGRLRKENAAISIFDVLQNTAALALAFASVIWLCPQVERVVMGIVCLALAAACYFAGFGPLRCTRLPRNAHVFAVWSACLLPAAIYLLLPLGWFSAILAIGGLAAIEIAIRMNREILELHGVTFLMIAAIASGMVGYAARALAGSMPTTLPWSVAVTAVCLVISFLAGHEEPDELWDRQALHFVPALLSACALMGFLVHGLVALVALAVTPGAFHLALVRTAAVCAVALFLALGGARWQRLEMRRLAYLATAFVVAKLLFEDMRHGHLAFTAASIALVALTLIAVPRLVRRERQA